MTVVLSIITLTMVFGIFSWKDPLRRVKYNTGEWNICVRSYEDGTASQYASLKSLDYIKQTGRCVTVGTAEAAGEDPGAEGETAQSVWSDGQIGTLGKICFVAYTKLQEAIP